MHSIIEWRNFNVFGGRLINSNIQSEVVDIDWPFIDFRVPNEPTHPINISLSYYLVFFRSFLKKCNTQKLIWAYPHLLVFWKWISIFSTLHLISTFLIRNWNKKLKIQFCLMIMIFFMSHSITWIFCFFLIIHINDDFFLVNFYFGLRKKYDLAY